MASGDPLLRAAALQRCPAPVWGVGGYRTVGRARGARRPAAVQTERAGSQHEDAGPVPAPFALQPVQLLPQLLPLAGLFGKALFTWTSLSLRGGGGEGDAGEGWESALLVALKCCHGHLPPVSAAPTHRLCLRARVSHACVQCRGALALAHPPAERGPAAPARGSPCPGTGSGGGEKLSSRRRPAESREAGCRPVSSPGGLSPI